MSSRSYSPPKPRESRPPQPAAPRLLSRNLGSEARCGITSARSAYRQQQQHKQPSPGPEGATQREDGGEVRGPRRLLLRGRLRRRELRRQGLDLLLELVAGVLGHLHGLRCRGLGGLRLLRERVRLLLLLREVGLDRGELLPERRGHLRVVLREVGLDRGELLP